MWCPLHTMASFGYISGVFPVLCPCRILSERSYHAGPLQSMRYKMQIAACRLHAAGLCHYPKPTAAIHRTQGKRVAVSGSGNVAVYTVEKLLELGAVPLTVSDSTGYVYYAEGMTKEDLAAVNEHKVVQHGRLTDFKTGARTPRPAPALGPVRRLHSCCTLLTCAQSW